MVALTLPANFVVSQGSFVGFRCLGNAMLATPGLRASRQLIFYNCAFQISACFLI